MPYLIDIKNDNNKALLVLERKKAAEQKNIDNLDLTLHSEIVLKNKKTIDQIMNDAKAQVKDDISSLDQNLVSKMTNKEMENFAVSQTNKALEKVAFKLHTAVTNSSAYQNIANKFKNTRVYEILENFSIWFKNSKIYEFFTKNKLIQGVEEAFKKIASFLDKFSGAGTFMGDAWKSIKNVVKLVNKKLGTKFNIPNTIDKLKKIYDSLKNKIMNFIGSFKTKFSNFLKNVIKTLVQSKIGKLISKAINWFFQKINKTILAKIASRFAKWISSVTTKKTALRLTSWSNPVLTIISALDDILSVIQFGVMFKYN